MPVFIPHGPYVPDELVHDLEDDRVVLFCGAGVSMGAGLPDFEGLVRDVYLACKKPPPPPNDSAWDWPDRMLGELEQSVVPGEVRSAVARSLLKKPKTLGMHRALLRLARLNRHDGLRLVTTNFDVLFEKADRRLKPGTNCHSGPILPIPRDDHGASWRSVVYLHGRANPPEPHSNDHLVITSADFGRAYLTERWASRFVSRLFAEFTVVFIGYSLKDPVLRYMTDAFAAEASSSRRGTKQRPAYIFVAEPATPVDPDPWKKRGLQPIYYKWTEGHRFLRDTVIAWAQARGDWLSNTEQVIERFSETPPSSLSPGDTDTVVWAIYGPVNARGYGAKLFSRTDKLPPVEWLDAFQKHEELLAKDYQSALQKAETTGEPKPPEPVFPLRALFDGDGCSDRFLPPVSRHLLEWLLRHLESEALIQRLARRHANGERLHAEARFRIREALSTSADLPAGLRLFWSIFAAEGSWVGTSDAATDFWRIGSISWETVPAPVVRAEFLDLLRPQVRLRPDLWRMFDETADEKRERLRDVVDAEIELHGEEHLYEILEQVEKIPEPENFLAENADELTSLLENSLGLWALVERADADFDPSFFDRPSIIPHEQNRSQDWTVVIDLLWRAWLRIDATSPTRSRALVGRWATICYPTFERLVLASVTESENWTTEEKLEVLLNGVR